MAFEMVNKVNAVFSREQYGIFCPRMIDYDESLLLRGDIQK
jgi:hypothetical protein